MFEIYSKATPKLLDALGNDNIKVTFFVTGKQVLKYPEAVRRAFFEGHEIGYTA
jgi:peptidoglycan/xylan/chitin deacetylase (PgdA/CDA1 family)